MNISGDIFACAATKGITSDDQLLTRTRFEASISNYVCTYFHKISGMSAVRSTEAVYMRWDTSSSR